MSEKPWSESLDEMLAKLNNGDFVDQSLYEFEKLSMIVSWDHRIKLLEKEMSIQQQIIKLSFHTLTELLKMPNTVQDICILSIV